MGFLSSIVGLGARFHGMEEVVGSIPTERGESPYWVAVRKIKEVRDLKTNCYRIESTDENPQFDWQQTIVSDGVRVAIGTHWQGKDAWSARLEMHDRVALSPVRILITADRANDLRDLSETQVHGALHHHLRLTWNDFPIDIFVNADTFLPDRIESVRSNAFDTVQNANGFTDKRG